MIVKRRRLLSGALGVLLGLSPVVGAQDQDPFAYAKTRVTIAGKAVWKSTVEKEARRHGMRTKWVDWLRSDAAYRTSDGNVMHVSTSASFTSTKDMRFVVAHEAAHYKIAKKCGTTRPPIAGKRFENVTDAFTVKVMGVPLPKTNYKTASGGVVLSSRTYGISTSDTAKARKIAGGTCRNGQKTVKVKRAGFVFTGRGVQPNLRYVVTKGARLAVIGDTYGGKRLVRDMKGRTGRVDPRAWQ